VVRKGIRRAVAAAAICLAILSGAPAQAAPAPVTITFDDDRAADTSITCNPELECAPSHHAWLRAKGIDVLGAPNGNLWMSRLEGALARNRVALGYASPGWGDRDGGISANEALAIRFLNAYASRVEIELTVLPTADALVNNVPTRAVVYGLDDRCQAVVQNSLTFTGATRGRLTPARVTVVAPRMGTVMVQVEEHPYGGMYVQSIRATPLTGPPPSEAAPCDPSKPVKPAEPTPRATSTVRTTATPRRSATVRATTTAPATPTRRPSAVAAACLATIADPAQAGRAVGHAIADLAEAADCLNRRGEMPVNWRSQLIVRFNGAQRHLVRGDSTATARMLGNASEHLAKLGRERTGYEAVVGELRGATDRLERRVDDPTAQ
jgi:hypothetical protein